MPLSTCCSRLRALRLRAQGTAGHHAALKLWSTEAGIIWIPSPRSVSVEVVSGFIMRRGSVRSKLLSQLPLVQNWCEVGHPAGIKTTPVGQPSSQGS